MVVMVIIAIIVIAHRSQPLGQSQGSRVSHGYPYIRIPPYTLAPIPLYTYTYPDAPTPLPSYLDVTLIHLISYPHTQKTKCLREHYG